MGIHINITDIMHASLELGPDVARGLSLCRRTSELPRRAGRARAQPVRGELSHQGPRTAARLPAMPARTKRLRADRPRRNRLRQSKLLFLGLGAFEDTVGGLRDRLVGTLRLGLVDNTVTDPDMPIHRVISAVSRKAPDVTINIEIKPP